MSVNETNGRVTLSTPSELKISKRLKSMLGLQVKGRFFPKQTYQGDRPLDFAVIKSLFVHLSDINESHNYHNGSGRVAQSVGHPTHNSGVLGSIPGLATYFRFSFRFFKKGSCQLLAKVCARSTG